jgi:hypothetical protein
MERTAEYIEPTKAGRTKMVLIAMAIAGLLEAAKRWLVPPFMAHVNTLPECEQYVWLANAVQAVCFVVPLLLSAFRIPIAVRMLRHQQFPLPGAWVWRRKKIQRGRIVVARAYLILVLCLVAYVFPFWARHILVKSNVHERCSPEVSAHGRSLSDGSVRLARWVSFDARARGA